MSEAKFTEGDWRAVNIGKHWNNADIDCWEIQWSEDGECVVDHVYEEKDAHLIAAAPDMYEHLALIQSLIAKAAASGHLTEELFLSNAKTHQLLTKARGES